MGQRMLRRILGCELLKLWVLFAALNSGPVAAESCLDYRFTIAATLQPGDVNLVIMAAGRAYVPVQSVGLVTYDGTDPANPIEAGTVPGICGIDAETVGSSAFVACGSVYRIDLVSGTLDPVVVERWMRHRFDLQHPTALSTRPVLRGRLRRRMESPSWLRASQV